MSYQRTRCIPLTMYKRCNVELPMKVMPIMNVKASSKGPRRNANAKNFVRAFLSWCFCGILCRHGLHQNQNNAFRACEASYRLGLHSLRCFRLSFDYLLLVLKREQFSSPLKTWLVASVIPYRRSRITSKRHVGAREQHLWTRKKEGYSFRCIISGRFINTGLSWGKEMQFHSSARRAPTDVAGRWLS